MGAQLAAPAWRSLTWNCSRPTLVPLHVARGIIDFVDESDRERSDIAQTIADTLDISYGDDECARFEATIRFALANRIPVDLDVVLDGCNRALDDLEGWASADTMAPLVRLRDALFELQRGE